MAQLSQRVIQARETIEERKRMADAPFLCQGRLTVQSGIPVPTTDLANQSILYFTPYQGSQIALYSGTSWIIHPYTEISLALSGLSAGTNYDVFVYDNSGTLALELTAWSNDSARATALVLQDGVYVRSGASTRRYVGTIRATSTTETQDTQTQRFVWNYYHRVRKVLGLSETANSWTYNTAAFRLVNGNSSNVLEYVSGFDEVATSIRGMALVTGTGTNASDISISFGLNTDTDPLAASPRGGSARNTIRQQLWGESLDLDNGQGYIRLFWIEYGNTNGVTWYGDASGDARVQSGVLGWIYG